MPTKAHMAAEAERITAASVAAHDTAAEALLVMAAGLKAGLYRAIAESRYGLVEEELLQAFDAGELTRALLAALVSDGSVYQHDGVYRVSLPGAA